MRISGNEPSSVILNSDWDHTDLGSGIFHERTHSSDVENITYSTPVVLACTITEIEMNRIMNRAIRPVLHETSKSHELQTEVKALTIRRIHTHTNRIQAIIVKRARPILTVILAIGVFDSATRPMTFKIDGHTAIKVHKVQSLICVL